MSAPVGVSRAQVGTLRFSSVYVYEGTSRVCALVRFRVR